MTIISASGCKEGSYFKSSGTWHQQTEPTCSYTTSTFVHLQVAYQQEKVLPKCLSLPSLLLLPTKKPPFCSMIWHTQQEAPKTENWSLPVQISLFLKVIISPKIWQVPILVAWRERNSRKGFQEVLQLPKVKLQHDTNTSQWILYTPLSPSPLGEWLRKSLLSLCLFCLVNRGTL